MTPDKLKEFYSDKAMMDAVVLHFVSTLNTLAIERVFKKQDTMGLCDARDILKRGFAELSEEEVEQAGKVATLQGVKLTEAVKDDLFTGWKAKRDKQVELQKAQLGGSKGAKASVKKTFDTQGLTDDDHRALFRESQ